MWDNDEFSAESVGLPALLRAWRVEAGEKSGRGKMLTQREVAQLMGVSERWYRALESGTRVPLTPETLTSLADALSLGPGERTALYSYQMSEISDEGQSDRSEDDVRTDWIRDFIAGQTSCPVYLVDRAWNLVGANDLMRTWFPWSSEPGANLLRWILQEPEARTQLVDWREQVTRYLAQLRFALHQYPEDANLRDLLEIVRGGPEFEELWTSGPFIVAFRQGGVFRLSLPHISSDELKVASQVFLPAYRPGMRMVALMPV
jgi:transcriptional regulator with XRE-family HTH domain